MEREVFLLEPVDALPFRFPTSACPLEAFLSGKVEHKGQVGAKAVQGGALKGVDQRRVDLAGCP